MGTRMVTKGKVIEMAHGPNIDYSSCNGCGICYEECPTDVFGWDKEKKRPTVIRPEECTYCVICEIDCPEVAIDIELPLWARVEHMEIPQYKK